jgi:2-dehydropantoate 2-reductase
MRILVLGAGATGGYYGGLLTKAGVDVTFLVREKRAATLKAGPLQIESPRGNIAASVTSITSETAQPDYDVVILSCKAYDLESAIAALRPAVHKKTLIVPLLNGMSHLAALDRAFGPQNVLGGSCQISVTLRPDGVIHNMIPLDALTLGARWPSQQEATDRLAEVLQRGGFEVRKSPDVIADMWDKWTLLATLAAMTTLLRADTGEIVATTRGAALMTDTLAECFAVATAHGNPIAEGRSDEIRALLLDPATHISASMRRDLEAGHPVEADHIIGNLIARGREKGIDTPMLEVAYTALEAYQNRRAASLQDKR